MKIILSPMSSDHDTEISVNGLVVTIDGTPYDLSAIPEGGQAEAEPDGPFSATAVLKRDEVKIKYFFDSATAKPQQSTDLADYTFEIVSGPVPDPIVRKPEPEEVPEDGV